MRSAYCWTGSVGVTVGGSVLIVRLQEASITAASVPKTWTWNGCCGKGPSSLRDRSERSRYDPRLLDLVRRGVAFRRARPLRPPDIAYRHLGAHQLAELRQHELLWTHVARLFLHPHDLAQVGILADQRRQLFARERIEQLHPGDRHVLGLRPRRGECEVVVHLAATQDEPAHGVAGRRGGVVEHRLEPSGRQIREPACGSRNRLFGVNNTSGRSSAWRAWRRSKWKYCAGVVQLAIRIFPSAPSARKRSMRALECSGPWP